MGTFIFKGMPIGTVNCTDKLNEKLNKQIQNHFLLGSRRTTIQDIEFSFEQISEIAIRALSPGVNNPYTAIHCIDRISQGISALSKINLPPMVLYSDENQPIVYRKSPSYDEIIGVALNRLREQAKSDLSVAIHLLKSIARFLSAEMRDEVTLTLKEQAKIIYQDAAQIKMSDYDLKVLERCYRELEEKNG